MPPTDSNDPSSDKPFDITKITRRDLVEMLENCDLEEAKIKLLEFFHVSNNADEHAEKQISLMISDVAKHFMTISLFAVACGDIGMAFRYIRKLMDKSFEDSIKFNNIASASNLFKAGRLDESLAALKSFSENQKTVDDLKNESVQLASGADEFLADLKKTLGLSDDSSK